MHCDAEACSEVHCVKLHHICLPLNAALWCKYALNMRESVQFNTAQHSSTDVVRMSPMRGFPTHRRDLISIPIASIGSEGKSPQLDTIFNENHDSLPKM